MTLGLGGRSPFSVPTSVGKDISIKLTGIGFRTLLRKDNGLVHCGLNALADRLQLLIGGEFCSSM
jgi:hypothetical protein